MSYLALVRHGESEWNALDLWTGWIDIPLSENGRKEAREAAEKLKDIHWDLVFESDLLRAHQTTEIILKTLNSPSIPIVSSMALKERNYGIYTGKNKLEIEKEIGEEKYFQLRRGWDEPIPNGETLKDVYERVIPYYQKEILPKFMGGKNILISAHGNSLRALVKYLKGIPDNEIQNFEMPTGEILIFKIENGKIV